MFKLSQNLIEVLGQNEIRYCHWKSNLLLNEALAGYDDLDLLVDEKDQINFEEIIRSLGFLEASNSFIHINNIKHFYGLDTKSGEILHLHVYSKILTGPSWIKSYHFNIEDYILANVEKHESGMPVPKKKIELVFFVFRVLLKHTKLTEIILVSKEIERNKKEFLYLNDAINKTELIEFLRLYFSGISENNFYNHLLIANEGSFFMKYLKASQLKKQLVKYNRYTFVSEFYKNTYQFIYRIINKWFLHQKKKIINGGKLIVVVGLDATGKTTITTELKKWLSKNFTTSLIHFGKPPSALRTRPLNVLLKIVRKNTKHNKKIPNNSDDKPRSLFYFIRYLALAYDRYRLISSYKKKVNNGEIVICDRYKSENYGVMDSPRLNPTNYRGLKRLIANYENNLYKKMPEPDLLLYLTVPVDVAVQRNKKRIKEGKESEEFLRGRYKINKDLKYDANSQLYFDTNRDYTAVLKDIKQTVWENI
jgi:thymidylate kinase